MINLDTGRLFFTVAEVASAMERDRRTIRRGIEIGEIPASKIGNTIRIPAAWLRSAAGLEEPAD